MTKISVVINTLNEEKHVKRLFPNLANFADEVVVCDMYSDDQTVEMAKKAGAKVYQHQKEDYVEPARNFAISKATGDWILILDPDEEIPDFLKNTLKEIASSGEFDFVSLPRKNIVFGKWLQHSRWWPDNNIRFFKKGKVKWTSIIHQPPETIGEGLILEAKEENALIHYHYESIEQFLNRLNRYTKVQSKLLIEDGYNFSWTDLIKKPADEFFSRYFFGNGYKDGLHGLALASMQAFSELVLYLKVWDKQGFGEQDISVKETVKVMKQTEKALHFWEADTLIKEGDGIVQKIIRKFRL